MATSAPKPSSGLPKSSTATVPFSTVPTVLASNDDFDSRHYPALPWAGPVFRGFIANHQPPGPFRLRFMFNPNQIDLGFTLNQNQLAFDQQANIATAGSIGGHSIGFTMYFNRQYEVAYRGDKLGVYKDINILKALVGIQANNGWMIMQALKFVFSDTLDGVFYGFIDSLGVKLGPFSEKMVPLMAEVQVSATFVPKTDDPKAITLYTGGNTTDTSK